MFSFLILQYCGRNIIARRERGFFNHNLLPHNVNDVLLGLWSNAVGSKPEILTIAAYVRADKHQCVLSIPYTFALVFIFGKTKKTQPFKLLKCWISLLLQPHAHCFNM